MDVGADLEGLQPRLPYDDPVPFRLTARARRVVDPAGLPELELVAGARALDTDARRARARALCRAGVPSARIARELDADPLYVEVWLEGLAVPVGGRRRAAALVASEPVPKGMVGAPATGALAARAAGRDEAARRLAAEPELRAGLALVAALGQPERQAVTVRTTEPALAVAAWRWLRQSLDAPAQRLRVVLRHAPDVTADLLVHDLVRRLDVDAAQVTTARWDGAAGGAVEVRLRLAEPDLAARVAGWRDHLLAELGGPTAIDSSP